MLLGWSTLTATSVPSGTRDAEQFALATGNFDIAIEMCGRWPVQVVMALDGSSRPGFSFFSTSIELATTGLSWERLSRFCV